MSLDRRAVLASEADDEPAAVEPRRKIIAGPVAELDLSGEDGVRAVLIGDPEQGIRLVGFRHLGGAEVGQGGLDEGEEELALPLVTGHQLAQSHRGVLGVGERLVQFVRNGRRGEDEDALEDPGEDQDEHHKENAERRAAGDGRGFGDDHRMRDQHDAVEPKDYAGTGMDEDRRRGHRVGSDDRHHELKGTRGLGHGDHGARVLQAVASQHEAVLEKLLDRRGLHLVEQNDQSPAVAGRWVGVVAEALGRDVGAGVAGPLVVLLDRELGGLDPFGLDRVLVGLGDPLFPERPGPPPPSARSRPDERRGAPGGRRAPSP